MLETPRSQFKKREKDVTGLGVHLVVGRPKRSIKIKKEKRPTGLGIQEDQWTWREGVWGMPCRGHGHGDGDLRGVSHRSVSEHRGMLSLPCNIL